MDIGRMEIQSGKPSDQPEHNLIVNYLPHNMQERELYSMFVTIGPIATCRVMHDSKTGYSYGFGFVCYVNPEDAAKAITKLNGIEIYEKRIKVSYARRSSGDLKDTNLYITNLPRHFTEVDLENLFSPYGRIINRNLLRDKFTNLPRGVGFVRFDKRDEASNAIQNLDQFIPEGACEPIGVRVAEAHGKQKADYHAGYQAALQLQSRGRPFGGRGGIPRGGASIPPFLVNIAEESGLNVRGLMQGGESVHGRGSVRGRGSLQGRGSLRGRGFGRQGGNMPNRGEHGGSSSSGGWAGNSNDTNNLVTYPVGNTSGVGAMRQERIPVRYTPFSSGSVVPNFN